MTAVFIDGVARQVSTLFSFIAYTLSRGDRYSSSFRWLLEVVRRGSRSFWRIARSQKAPTFSRDPSNNNIGPPPLAYIWRSKGTLYSPRQIFRYLEFLNNKFQLSFGKARSSDVTKVSQARHVSKILITVASSSKAKRILGCELSMTLRSS